MSLASTLVRAKAANQQAQTCLALDNAVWDTHFAAQGRKEKHQLKRINIMSNYHQLSFLLLNQLGNGVGTGTHKCGLLLGLNLLALNLGLGQLLQALLLGQSRFWAAFLQQLEHFHGCGLVQSLAELMNWWWNFQASLQDGLLALNANVLGPTHKTRQITLGLNILSNAKVLGSLLEELIDNLLDNLLLNSQWCGCNLLGHGLLLWLGL